MLISIISLSVKLRLMKPPTPKIALAWSVLAALLLMLSACSPVAKRQEQVLPNQAIGHRVAEQTTVIVWARRPDGKLVKQSFTIGDGWYIFPPATIDSPKGPTP